MKSLKLRKVSKVLKFGVVVLAATAWAAPVAAESEQVSLNLNAIGGQSLAGLEVGKDYALGLTRYDLDAHTELLGWQLSDTWYLGRQDGEDSGLTLVWQKESSQVSVSKDGLRLTRRF